MLSCFQGLPDSGSDSAFKRRAKYEPCDYSCAPFSGSSSKNESAVQRELQAGHSSVCLAVFW